MKQNPSDKKQRFFKVTLDVASPEGKTTLQCGLIPLSSSLPILSFSPSSSFSHHVMELGSDLPCQKFH